MSVRRGFGLRWWWAPTTALLLLVACGGDPGPASRESAPTTSPTDVPVTSSTSAVTTSSPPGPSTSSSTTSDVSSPGTPRGVVEVRYRVERRTSDAATADFESVVDSTLTDRRGWERAGFRLVRDPRAEYLVVLAEGDEVDRLCLPYDTYGKYSCQNGPTVALNADRWRTATSKWTGDLATYRQMLVNHEVGHLLGQHHRRCTTPGQPAAVMVQQSTELDGCTPNAWPLDVEVERAARHDLPLAPPFDRTDWGDDW